jgi:hypothetical protein
MTRYVVISTLAVAALLAILLGQQPGGVDEIRARAAQDVANQAAYRSEPGGTPCLGGAGADGCGRDRARRVERYALRYRW